MYSKFLDRKPNLKQKCDNVISATDLRHFVPRTPSRQNPFTAAPRKELAKRLRKLKTLRARILINFNVDRQTKIGHA